MNPFRRSRVLSPLNAKLESKEDHWKRGPNRLAFPFSKPQRAKLEALRNTSWPVVLTYDPDARVHPSAEITHIQDEERVLQRMLEEFDTFGRTIVGWPYQTVEVICPGSFCVLVQDGDHPHGCFAKGEIIGGPLTDVDGRSIVVAMFRKMTDPRRGRFL